MKSSLNFVARAALRESAGIDPHAIAMRAAELAYNETMSLMEAEESRTKRYAKTAGKIALGAGGAYAAGMGGFGAIRSLRNGATYGQAAKSGLAHIRNPRKIVRGLQLARAKAANPGGYFNAAVLGKNAKTAARSTKGGLTFNPGKPNSNSSPSFKRGPDHFYDKK